MRWGVGGNCLAAVLLGAVPLLAACGNYDPQVRLSQLYEANDNLLIDGPALDSEGRRLAFHFNERVQDNRRSPYNIAVYDIAADEMRILPLADGLSEIHSPNFSPDGLKLAMIAACFPQACPPEKRGSNILVYDFASGGATILTEGMRKQPIWELGGRMETARLAEVSLQRTQPVFSARGTEIYYLGSRSRPDMLVHPWHFTLRWISQRSGKDGLVLDEASGATFFSMTGSLAPGGRDRLWIIGRPGSGGPRAPSFWDEEVFGHLYDVKANSFVSTLSGSDLPRAAKGSQPLSRTATAANDGLRLALGTTRPYAGVILWEEGRPRPLLRAQDLGMSVIGDIALSGDSGCLAAFSKPLAERGKFWLIEVDSGAMRALPIAERLRQALDAEQRPPALL